MDGFTARGTTTSSTPATRSPKNLPSYYSIQYNGSVSGAMSKWASFFVSVEQRDTQTDNVYSILGGPLYDAATNTFTQVAPTVTVNGSLFSPANHLEVSPRVDLQLGQKNTLTLRYQFYLNNVKGSLSATSLPSTSATNDSLEHTIQLDDTELINDKLVNETRFEYRRANSSSTPVSLAPGASVPRLFATGGDSAQNSSTHDDHFELQNYLTLSEGKQAIKMGVWLRDDREAQSTDSNFNGSFSFPIDHSLREYMEQLGHRPAARQPTAPRTLREGACPPSSPTPPGRSPSRAMSSTPRRISRMTGR